jgi:hypothetical protein
MRHDKRFSFWGRDLGFGLCLNLGNHKYLEVELEFWHEWYEYFKFMSSWSKECDHAGFTFHFSILGFWTQLSIHDNRHWNDDVNRWYESGEELKHMLEEGRITRDEYNGYIAACEENNKDGEFRKSL